ncbi:GNAT family N-acetyltransferase [Hwangdonia seohaensis]|uniref:GNAT family N-acetyltransferase n=1 Tax=Hwangdonia seohaensis TaxID=1240727 RepID=A0ABW3R856_9FLAO|nr:GNAT family N-acetyltransferase [Hwangdonia seohaensis]
MMIIAETERLLISKFTLFDAPFFLQLANSPNCLKYIGDKNLKNIADTELYLQDKTIKSYADFGFGFYKLTLKKNNKPIGTCGLAKRDKLDDVDIGFAFLEDYEGQGLGFEASVEIIKLAKFKFNLKKIVAITNPDNRNSIKLLEKLGLLFEKRVNPFDDDEELLLFAKTI